LVASIGERLDTAPSEVAVFEREVIFHKFDFETSDLEIEVSKSSI
jgi:hypothetical protein